LGRNNHGSAEERSFGKSMMIYFWIMIFMQLGSAIFLLVLFNKYKKYQDSFPKTHLTQAQYPGISVLIPIKGPVEHLEASLGAILKQTYPGEVEYVLAFQDQNDPSLPHAQELVKRFKPTAQVKWLKGLIFRGLNPKNSNLSYAFEVSTYPWVFSLDVDTICHENHLKECMDLVRGDELKFVTSVTIHEQGQNLWAMFEGIGTNLEMNLYFFSHYFGKQKPVPINGAAVLFSKKLMIAIGGYSRLVDELAEDATMMKEFPKAGGEGFLSPHFVRVIQREQNWKGLFQRYVRWLMVVRCYMPPLFVIAPFIWWGFWNLVAGLVLHSQELIMLGCLLLFIRVILTLKVQTLVGVPKEDYLKGFTIIVYDLIMPLFWFVAIFKKKLVWAGVPLKVMREGNLIKAKNE
jgi:cellulose synthase/poly-beta-1,6-N-acetylglucosamine synthase-like glycosyltransferase